MSVPAGVCDGNGWHLLTDRVWNRATSPRADHPNGFAMRPEICDESHPIQPRLTGTEGRWRQEGLGGEFCLQPLGTIELRHCMME